MTAKTGTIKVNEAITSTDGNVNLTVDKGDIQAGNAIHAAQDIAMTTAAGAINVGNTVKSVGGNVQLTADQGDIQVNKDVQAAKDIAMTTATGTIAVGDAVASTRGNVELKVGQGDITVGKVVQADNGSIGVQVGTGNIVAADVTAKVNANMTVQNGNIRMHDVTAGQDVTVSSTVQGSINAHNIISGGITHVALNQGDLFLNLAEGKGVLLQMENNTEVSKVNQILAEASGTGPDVALTGNYIQIGSVKAKGGDAVFELSAMGAGNQELISGNFFIGSLTSKYGTHMSNLWSNRGYVHVDEGALLLDDVLAVDKIHLDNAQTDIAIFGRTPTRDGEQLTYWNNLSMADSKTRSYQLYTDGRVRTHSTVLFDGGMNLYKLYGDNLSVLDMMNERENGRHGVFTFDRRMFTEPGKRLREQVIFDPKMWDFVGWQSNEEEDVVDKEK